MASFYIELPVSGSGSSYWKDAVANFAALPVSASIGETRLALDTLNGYTYTGSAWQLAWTAGAVGGPASSTDKALPRFNGTTGKIVQNSGVIVDDSNNVTGIAALTITGVATLATSLTGPIRGASGVISAGNTSLTSEVSGILPVASGGTNSSTALNGNRFAISSGGKIVEASAVTANRAITSDVSGLPTASATTDTEIGYVSGVTSAIQTQLNAKMSLAGGTFTGPVLFSGASTYFRLPNLTTTQRDALTAAKGMIIYNTTVDTAQIYLAGTVNNWVDFVGWGAAAG